MFSDKRPCTALLLILRIKFFVFWIFAQARLSENILTTKYSRFTVDWALFRGSPCIQHRNRNLVYELPLVWPARPPLLFTMLRWILKLIIWRGDKGLHVAGQTKSTPYEAISMIEQ